jgi:hypothetical protein
MRDLPAKLRIALPPSEAQSLRAAACTFLPDTPAKPDVKIGPLVRESRGGAA